MNYTTCLLMRATVRGYAKECMSVGDHDMANAWNVRAREFDTMLAELRGIAACYLVKGINTAVRS